MIVALLHFLVGLLTVRASALLSCRLHALHGVQQVLEIYTAMLRVRANAVYFMHRQQQSSFKALRWYAAIHCYKSLLNH